MPVGRNVRWLAKVKKRWTGLDHPGAGGVDQAGVRRQSAHGCGIAREFPLRNQLDSGARSCIVPTTNSSQEGGNGFADVLFGDYNPGGKLVDTWPKSLDELPLMMDYDLRHGRTYMYFKASHATRLDSG
jgi:hypothetical protein